MAKGKIQSINDAQESEGNAGHNSKSRDELTKKYVTFVAERNAKIKKIRDEIKEEMVSAKDDGCDATAIRKAAKYLTLDADQRAAKDEEAVEVDRITALCKDLPLFQAA